MADFSDEQKDYLGGLMRGLALALGTGHLNSAMRAGDPDWVPPHTLLEVLRAIGGVSGGGDGATSDEIKEALKEAQREGTG